jgi:hypothetical protein
VKSNDRGNDASSARHPAIELQLETKHQANLQIKIALTILRSSQRLLWTITIRFCQAELSEDTSDNDFPKLLLTNRPSASMNNRQPSNTLNSERPQEKFEACGTFHLQTA